MRRRGVKEPVLKEAIRKKRFVSKKKGGGAAGKRPMTICWDGDGE